MNVSDMSTDLILMALWTPSASEYREMSAELTPSKSMRMALWTPSSSEYREMSAELRRRGPANVPIRKI